MRAMLKKILPPVFRNRVRGMFPAFLLKKISYAQCGEDLVISFVLDLLCGSGPKRYLDVGANHPFYLSNTALLYQGGGHGILVEPDPYFAKLLRRRRPRDKVLEVGVHFLGESTAEFFILDTPTLNTFSRLEMERYVAMGHKLLQSVPVKLRNINELLSEAGHVDFMNLDIEGFDQRILEMINWCEHRPTCVCVETVAYETRCEPKKLDDIIFFMRSVGYMHYAETFINSIFVDHCRWEKFWDRR